MTTPRASRDDEASVDEISRGDLRTYWNDGQASFRYQLSGNGSTLVVLDSGIGDHSKIWANVAPKVAKFARVLVVDQFTMAAGPVTVSQAGHRATLEHLAALVDQAAPGRCVVLAGWAVGCLNVQQLAVNRPDHYLGMVLINPIPVAALDAHVFEQMTDRHRNNAPTTRLLRELSAFIKVFKTCSLLVDGTHAFERILVTILLPGSSPDPTEDLGKKLIELQRQDIERFSHPREIIAGRSRSAIPIERPDVVIDAIADIVSRIVRARASQTQ